MGASCFSEPGVQDVEFAERTQFAGTGSEAAIGQIANH
jgi:hypothetical protein